jgi:hypothetical protein
MQCEHMDFYATVDVNRLVSEGRPVEFVADVRIQCAKCGLSFGFVCPEVGMLPDRPAVSVDGGELRVPLKSPEGVVPAFPGFRVLKAG